jgi:hypothetical protein
VKLTTYLHPVRWSIMRGAIPLLPNTPSWRGAELKHRDYLTYIRGPFAKFVESTNYSESELCGGAVTVSFSKNYTTSYELR